MNKYKLSKAGVDANEGIRRFNNNREVFESFLKTFPESGLYEKMVDCIKEKNVEEAFRQAHSLKGVSGNLSLVKLHADLIPLVEELKAGSLEKAPELLSPVTESYNKVVEMIKEEREK